MTTEAYVYDAIRTPRGRGKANGSLHGTKPIDLVVGLPGEDIDGVKDAGSALVLYGAADGSGITTTGSRTLHQNSPGVPNENEKEVGPYSMKEATALSVNTYFVQMISEIGTCPVIELSKKMGIERSDGNDFGQGPSIALGTQ
ncbi:hypothetical protein ADL27_12835, partial [Streptomyces sp. NRRL F-6602]